MSNEYSYSRVEKFKICPYSYYLRYLVKAPPDDNIPAPNNPCIVGTALHHGIEAGIEPAIEEYKENFCIASNGMIEEIIKLEHMIPLVQAELNHLAGDCPVTFEYKLTSPDGFVGFIDCLIKYPDNTYGIYDFKYSNQQERYKQSAQIHLYKHFFEQMNPGAKVSRLGYIMIDKVMIRQKKTEVVGQFRNRLDEAISNAKVTTIEIEYNPEKVRQFFTELRNTLNATEFPKCPSFICNWCEYFEQCQIEDLSNAT